MAQRGVDTGLVEVRAASQTGFVVILNVAGSQRRMIRYRGANLLLADDVLRRRSGVLRSAEVVHTSSVRPAVVRTLVEMGLRLSWDPGWIAVSRYREEALELMKTGQVLRAFFNEKELRALTRSDDLRKGAASIHEMGVEEVVIKRGGAGSAALTFKTWYEAPALRVRVADTTGAGDVFDGAYTVARLRGLSPREALKAANFAAGRTVEVPGAVKGLPSWNEIRSFLGEAN
ncbi:MAG TPA: carbohydrate kinase family protein [Candidatus Korarchaeota archaeon]|nr:carbohydrate kinase family protein [Candidatus Korarchaeota archaeon]